MATLTFTSVFYNTKQIFFAQQIGDNTFVVNFAHNSDCPFVCKMKVTT